MYLCNKIKTVGNFSYPSSAAAVVFCVHLSARAAFQLDRKSPAVRPCVFHLSDLTFLSPT